MKNFINRALVAKKHLKLFFALFAMLALGVGNAWGAEEVTFSFADATQRVSQDASSQVWKSGEVVFTNAKGTGNAVVSNTNPIRCYQGSSITIEAPGNISKLVFVCNTTAYATALGISISSGDEVSSKNVTVTTSGSATYTISSLSAQVRINSLTVTYEAGNTTPKQKYTLTYQAGSVKGSLKVEEGANLLDALKDITPEACDPTSTEPIGWSESEITTKQADAPTLLTDADVMPSEAHSVYYVFAKKETTGGGEATEKTGTYTFSNYTAGTQYAKNEEHKLDDDVTIYTNDCHFTSELRIYSSNTNNGYVVSNELPGKIVSMGFNAGNKVDVLVVSGSTDGSTWNQVGEVSVTSTSYKDYTLSFGETNYTYFKLDVKGANQVRLKKMSVTYMSGGGTTTISDYTTSCSGTEEPAYSVTVTQPAEGGSIEADKNEAKAGDIVKLTAKPSTGYNFDTWTVTGASGNVSVTDNQFTMPAEEVTVTASFVAKEQYTIKWNVAEGSVADTKVYEGEALGSLPPAPNCSEGKVFVGWTEATLVNPDGSGITYAKSTDVPAGHKEYNAVYATLSGSANKVDNLDLSLTGASGSTYSSWSGKESVSDAVYAGNSAGGNSSIQLRHDTEKEASGVITTTSGGKATKVAVTWHSSTTNGRTLNVYGNNTPYSTVKDLWDGEANQGTLLGTIVYGTSTELQIEGDYKYIGLRSKSGAMYLSQIDITWSATSASDYSLNCEVNNTPFLTVTETPIDFGTVAQNETVTETFTVTGGYLAEDVALTISGTDASFFSVSPATITKADDVEETVTVTYNPTATGDHTATLTIKTGDITKEIALSGKVLAPGKWVLVKDIATLSAGDEIIIAAADADYAIGAAASNNYKGAAITKVGETANADAGVTVLKVEATGDAEVPYAFKAGSNYLYAASSSANQLKGKTTLDVNGQWAVTITAEGVASIEAAKSTNRKVMQYNPNSGSPIFACYETASQKALAIYRNSENVVKPVISGDADFTGSTQVTITAQSGLTVYYTTDDSDPDNTSTQYTAPFTINETTTVKAIAYDASSNASGVAEMTFTKHDLVNVATAMALAKDEIAYFDEFEVVKVVTGKGNIYIKDASGHGLIYDNTLAGELKDGDRVQGFVGISSPYEGLPEAKPVDGLTVADLTITSGTPAEPYNFTSTAITVDDLNKYIVFKEVPMDADVDVTTHPTLTINGNSVNLRNSFNVTKTLENGKKYDIYGFVSIYNEELRVSFYQALEQGEVVKTYTVTYNAGGATGEVPVDNNEYIAGAQVLLKSAPDLTLEGYEFASWKVTDESANEITVTSNKFNMPASNVTVTAQWEEIVVTPKKDFSEGYWVLVTNESELQSDDYVVIAAADYDVAMKSYESGNNCKQVNITKVNDFLIWNENVGVFQLAKEGENYTFQDVNTAQYLYAAGGTSSNHLKASDAIPTSEEAQKYVWTITIADRVATVTANVEGRNTIRYNATEGANGQLFSCYASGQKDIALYKYVDTYTYTRNVTNKFGTICLPYASASTAGAYFYHVAGQGVENGDVAVYLESVDALEAGVPYIFEATASTITVTCQGTPVAEAGSENGLVGTFTNETVVPEGSYILYNNAFSTSDNPEDPNKVNAYRAYLNLSAVTGGKPTQMPGRRYIGMSVEGENEATGLDNIQLNTNTQKLIINGQLIIIRDGEMYNAMGVKL